MAHGLVVRAALPLHFHHKEAVLCRHLDEAGSLGLGAGVVHIAVQQHHNGHGMLRSAFQQFLRPVFIPQPLGVLAGGLFHDDTLDAQGLAVQVRFQFVGAVFSQLSTFVMSMLIIIVAVIAAQNLLPGIFQDGFQGGLGVRVHHHLQQGFVFPKRLLISFGHLGGIFPSHIRRDGLRFLAGLAAHRKDIGYLIPRTGSDDLVYEGGAATQTHHFQVAGATEHIEQLLKYFKVGFRVLVPGGIDHHGRSVVGVQQGLDVQIGQ